MGGRTLHELERSLQLLRRQGVDGWAQYLLGAVPLLLAALAFVHDMTSGYAAERCLAESLICALVFFWSAVWKARFAGTLFAAAGDEQDTARSSFLTCLFVQAVLQSLKLIVLPAAAISVFPLAWASAFFRSATLEADRAGCTLRIVIRKSWNQASTSVRSTWLALLMVATIAIVIFINVFTMVLLFPALVKIFTGYENEWTRGAGQSLNWNVFAIAVGLTWLVMDPLIQAYFVPRCFYSEARTNGRDLLVRLRHLAALFLVALTIGGAAAQAQSQTISKDELDRGLKRVLQEEEFGWQRAHKTANSGNSFLDRVSRDVAGAAGHVRSWFSALGDWIRKLIRKSHVLEKERARREAPTPHIQWWMYSIGAVILLAMIVVLFRKRPLSTLPTLPETDATLRQPDLTNDQLLASDMPDNEWLRLAREYIGNGDLRLAIRAMYLSNLAYLGARQLIAIAKSKSNGVYERELRLRARADAISVAFATTNRGYERAWYGLHDVTPESIEAFELQMQVIRQHA